MHRRTAPATVAALLLLGVLPSSSAAGGRASAPAAPERLSVSLTGQASTVQPGSYAELTLQISDPAASHVLIEVDFGDTTRETHSHVAECVRTPPYRQAWKLRHAYRRSGTWPVTVRVTTGGCDSVGERPTGPDTEVAAAATKVTVGPGRDVSNGPERPDMRAGLDARTFPRAGKPFDLQINGADGDGILRQVQVLLPNGKTRTTNRGKVRCDDPYFTWPSDAWSAPPIRLTIKSAGTHAIRTTAISSGCDGRSTQRYTTTSTVQVDP